MIWLKRLLMSVGVLALVLLAVVVFKNGFSTTPAHVLAEHPDARWQGGPDGGHYIEITRSEPPYFFVQVRHESGDLWDEGWLKYEDGDASALTTDKVLAFDGDGVIYLQQRKVLAPLRSSAH
ncbi:MULTISPECIES: hypothetical protein [Pseudomonas]|uniref:hypothetical protein n=1 Tax=Pseudomonas TaxID=286 RepID=UPI000F46FFF0|nr:MULTISPECIES: hypothetical protein [Pseudomonas]MCS4259997.1 hypothetical protein [Pseudomonas sp. BIGb0176]